MAGPASGGGLRGLIPKRRTHAPPDHGRPITAPVRLGKRTKDLVKRLEVGEAAVIDHADLDRVAAEDLAASGVVAVINVARFSTGRYPNVGPLILAQAGVILVEAVDEPLFDQLDDGDIVRLEGGDVRLGNDVVARGVRPSPKEIEARLGDLRTRIDRALSDFAVNTLEHVQEERALLSGEIPLPDTRTRFSGRHVLIVVRGPDYREDLNALRAYARDVRPLIIGVDGGADAVLERGMKPDVILGDMDSATDGALRSGAELIVHAYPDGRAPGRERLEEAGLDHLVIPAAGTSQDVAMLLAHEKGASLIVSVGAHFNVTEFLDKNRAGMSSTFLTRLRVGETLVDAKGVSRLYRPGLGKLGVAMFLGAFVFLLVIVILASPGLDNVTELLWIKIKDALGI
jgi:uncharacterized membrane-anchored protein